MAKLVVEKRITDTGGSMSEQNSAEKMVMHLIDEDLHHVLSRTPRDVVTMLRKTPRLLMGGGFIRCIISGEKVNDIDLFGPSKAELESVAKSFALDRKARFFPTDNAFNVLTPDRHPVQFIHRWLYESPEQLIKDFDFSIAQAVIWWQPGEGEQGEWKSLVSDFYYADLASKRLRYLAPARAEDAGGSILRMRKFLTRGYHIEAHSLAKVVSRLAMGVRQVADAGINEPDLGRVITGLLREVDPMTVIDGLELVNEHQKIEDIGAPAPLMPEVAA